MNVIPRSRLNHAADKMGKAWRRWLRLRFPNGWEQWVPEERVERVARLIDLEEDGWP